MTGMVHTWYDISMLTPSTETNQSAKDIGLRYTHDDVPGITRIRHGKSFSYEYPDRKKVTDRETLDRIRLLAIPPAYTNVWISTFENGHLQATGIDARKRKQYRYHPKWNKVRNETKFHRMVAFGKVLPKIRRTVAKDLKKQNMPKEKVLATIVALLDKTLIRVGNEEYAKENNSYGLTTLHNKHISIAGSTIHFEFKGKSGVNHAINLQDKRLAKIVRDCKDIPGYELFQYIDEQGERHSIHSEDVNEYIKNSSGGDFTAKDFRTWHGTILACEALKDLATFDTETEGKKNVVSAIAYVAAKLGNTKAVCRKSYIHPDVINCYLDKSLVNNLTLSGNVNTSLKKLHPEEAAVVRFLEKRAKTVPSK